MSCSDESSESSCEEAYTMEELMEPTKIFSPILPIILCALLGYIVGSAFLFVYDLGIETLLVSFCIDKDENTEGTYRCSPSLARAAGITA